MYQKPKVKRNKNIGKVVGTKIIQHSTAGIQRGTKDRKHSTSQNLTNFCHLEQHKTSHLQQKGREVLWEDSKTKMTAAKS